MSIALEAFGVLAPVVALLIIVWECLAPPHREKRYRARCWQAYMMGYAKGGRECEIGGGMPPIPEPLLPFDAYAPRRERESVTHANCLTAFQMGRIEGWHTALATEPEDRQEEDIEKAVEQMVNWVHGHDY